MILDLKTLNLKDRVPFELVKVKPPFTNTAEMPNEACFIYVLNGTMKVRTVVNEFECNSKDGVLLKCGNSIGEMLPTTEVYEALVIHLYPDLLKELIENKAIPKQISTNKVVVSEVIKDKLLEKFIDSVLFYFENQNLVDDEILHLKLRELILLLLKIDSNGIIENLIQSLFKPVELSFKETIENHIYHDISIEQLAFLTNRSLSTFKRDFKKFYKKTPSKYILNRKLEKAAQLLIDTDLSISDVIFKCGIKNSSHFTKAFKERYQESPTSFRLSQIAK